MIKLVKAAAVAAAIVAGTATAAWAGCHFETYFVNGKMVSCTVCWNGNNKTVNCI